MGMRLKMEKLKDGEFAHVIAVRDPKCEFKRETNIRQRIRTSQDFEWGYSGQGPTDFAFNILLHFTNGDEAFARKNYCDFLTKFVVTLPRPGGTIHKESILEFIQSKAQLA